MHVGLLQNTFPPAASYFKKGKSAFSSPVQLIPNPLTKSQTLHILVLYTNRQAITNNERKPTTSKPLSTGYSRAGNSEWCNLLFLCTWVRASWIEFNSFPTRCDLFSLLHYCRQLYMFRVLTPIIRSSYNCKYYHSPSLLSWNWFSFNSTTKADGSRSGQSIPEAVFTVVRAPWWVSTPETCRTAYSNAINWISRI